jgi:NTP pyrophosphatase (non-canonical NTP hydrolase)
MDNNSESDGIIPCYTLQEVRDILKLAICTYGEKAQTQMLFEEMAELQDALCKLARGRDTIPHVQEEIADVLIMVLQMAEAYGMPVVQTWFNAKLKRLKERITHGK